VVVCSNIEVYKEWEGGKGARHCKFFGLGKLHPTFDDSMLRRVALAARDTDVHTSCVHMWTRRRGARVVVCSNMEVNKEWEGGRGHATASSLG
jgi:hypothetical protein